MAKECLGQGQAYVCAATRIDKPGPYSITFERYIFAAFRVTSEGQQHFRAVIRCVLGTVPRMTLLTDADLSCTSHVKDSVLGTVPRIQSLLDIYSHAKLKVSPKVMIQEYSTLLLVNCGIKSLMLNPTWYFGFPIILTFWRSPRSPNYRLAAVKQSFNLIIANLRFNYTKLLGYHFCTTCHVMYRFKNIFLKQNIVHLEISGTRSFRISHLQRGLNCKELCVTKCTTPTYQRC